MPCSLRVGVSSGGFTTEPPPGTQWFHEETTVPANISPSLRSALSFCQLADPEIRMVREDFTGMPPAAFTDVQQGRCLLPGCRCANLRNGCGSSRNRALTACGSRFSCVQTQTKLNASVLSLASQRQSLTYCFQARLDLRRLSRQSKRSSRRASKSARQPLAHVAGSGRGAAMPL